MNYKLGRSTNNDVRQAVDEASAGLKSPKLILFFSDVNDFEKYSNEIKNKFNSSIVIGSTTYAAFCSEGAYKNTLMILGIEDGIECYGDVLEDADKYPVKYVERISKCVNKFEEHSNVVCFEISNAFISCEELVLSVLHSVLSEKKIPLFGGTAGNDRQSEKNLISFNGKVYTNACAFVLIKNLNGGIKIYRENIYKKTEHHFTATKVDLRERIVYEYNDRPAAEVISEALHVNVNELGKYLDNNPLGRIVGKEMYITANNSIMYNNAMSYHARVYKNSDMVLLTLDDYRSVMNETNKKIKQENKNPSLAIMVNCLARTMLFENDGCLNEFARNMGDTVGDYIGLSGYGEQLGQQHFNMTMVIAVFE